MMARDWETIDTYKDLLCLNAQYLVGHIDYSPTHSGKDKDEQLRRLALWFQTRRHAFVADWQSSCARRSGRLAGSFYTKKNYVWFVVPKLECADLVEKLFHDRRDAFQVSVFDMTENRGYANYDGGAVVEEASLSPAWPADKRVVTQWLPQSANGCEALRCFELYPNIARALHTEGVYVVHVCSREPVLEYLCQL
jgi:hypothetical protein